MVPIQKIVQLKISSVNGTGGRVFLLGFFFMNLIYCIWGLDFEAKMVFFFVFLIAKFFYDRML
jgi:hypothetical protein